MIYEILFLLFVDIQLKLVEINGNILECRSEKTHFQLSIISIY